MSSNFSADCLRKASNWTVAKNYHKFDKKEFDPVKLKNDIRVMSPKVKQLFENIKELDEIDMKTHGKVFKHFVFSELRNQAMGAKMLAGCFIAHGWKLVYDTKHKLLQREDLIKSKSRNFALLTSAPIFEKNIGVKTKKDVLSLFNTRPNNIHGDLCRIIVLSGDFKEGIDLFDVKYAHVLEPQTSKADLRQVIGRGTRLCGQSGLEFHPTRGWPLNVFIYDVALPTHIVNKVNSNTLYELYLKNSNIDLRKISFASELESATIHAAIDYELNKNIHNFEIGNDDAISTSWLFDSKKGGGDQQQGSFVFDKSCSSKPTEQMPVGTPLMLASYLTMGKTIESLDKRSSPPLRKFLCEEARNNPEYRKVLRKAWDDPIGYLNRHKKYILNAVLENQHHYLDETDQVIFVRFCRTIFALSPRATRNVSIQANPNSIDNQKHNSKKKTPLDYKDLQIQVPDIDVVDDVPKLLNNILPKYPNFLDIRNHVREYFVQYTWPKVKMENMCLPKRVNSVKDKKSPTLDFTPTQNFLREFFSPASPMKGLLAWHSVGTGKTCLAIATASTTFENEGYTILWVTRASLKSDIWKNMFDQVCNVVIQEQIKAGKTIPQDLNERLRLLSKSWSIRPMSYKQFTNLVEGKNKFYDDLIVKNGKEDPLRKTLLIIDEAHKLYGGNDLSAQERPNMKKLKAALMNSYEKSGNDSVKLFMMTGTPITNDPMEMCKLVNLLKEKDKQLPEDFEEFSSLYLDSTGKFTKKGKWNFLNNVAGCISYLSREKDARQFSQPIVSNVLVKMSESELVAKQQNKEEIQQAISFLKDQEYSIKENLKDVKMVAKKDCKDLKGDDKKSCIAKKTKATEESLIRINDEMSDLKDRLKEAKIRTSGKDDVSQEYAVMEKCKANGKT